MPDVTGLPEPNIPMDQGHETTAGSATLDGDTVKFTSDAPTMEAVLPERVDLTSLSKAPESALLENFLRRPVNIHTFSWTDSTSGFHIDPWALFLNTPSVVDKISFYRFLRGTLRIEVQLNGTPFHFGRILCSYEPCNWNRMSNDANFPTHSALPHAMLDPSANTVAKLDAPFIHPGLWIDTQSQYGAGVGVLNFDPVAPLAVFEGGSPAPVTVQVYAWMEDMELSFPTQLLPRTFIEQGKKSKGPNGGRSDEYEVKPNTGIISAPAAAIANVAGRLKDVPVIGKFATATEIGSNAVASIASLFGWSRPKDLTAECKIVTNVTGPMATVDQAAPVASVTVNSKSELSIDPCIIGMNSMEDELAVNAIANKWAIVQVLEWDRTRSPNQHLIRAGISPGMFVADLVNPDQNATQLTPLAFASVPFNNWTGSIEMKVQVVASRYHRGRLRFQWTSGETLTQDIQKGYNHVVDISDTQEFTLKFPYVGSEGYKKVGKWSNGGFSHATYESEQTTGVISVIVQNELVCPTDEPIKLIIWIRGGSDIAFVNPDFDDVARVAINPAPAPALTAAPSTRPRLHKDVKEQGGAGEELGAAAEKEEEIISFFEATNHPDYDLAYFGDPVLSFRSLIKRYSFVTAVSNDVTLAEGNFSTIGYHIPLYPQIQGIVDQASWSIQTGNLPVNVTATHLATYLQTAFLCNKGGFRHIIDFEHADGAGNIQPSNILVKRSLQDGPYYGSSAAGIGETIATGPRAAAVLLGKRSGSNERRDLNNQTPGGGQIFPYKSDGHRVEVELPFYSNWRYATGFGESNPTAGNSTLIPGWNNGGTSLDLIHSISPSTVGQVLGDYHPICEVYSAAAEDFTMHFFRGVPELYYNTLPSAPTDIADSWRTEVYPQL